MVVSSAIYNVNSVLDNGLLAYNFKSLGMEEEFISQWGVYTGKYHLLINVPMAVSNALSSSLIPSVSRAVATGEPAHGEKEGGRCDPVFPPDRHSVRRGPYGPGGAGE